jgi:hypothetical protein
MAFQLNEFSVANLALSAMFASVIQGSRQQRVDLIEMAGHAN